MKKSLVVTAILSVIIIVQFSILAKDNAEKGFEMLKSLAGEWQGKTSQGKSVHLSYEIVSNGSVLMETLKPEQEPEMITLYHLNKDKLMLTHYCSAKNQPRMKLEKIDPDSKEFHFSFLDITNLLKPEDGHMRGLTLTIVDEDHLKQGWTWKQGDQEQTNEFELTRVK